MTAISNWPPLIRYYILVGGLGGHPYHGIAVMKESLKQKVERAIGDQFVKWFNRVTGSEFQFDRPGADPPDLLYRDRDNILPIEVATSYYHEEDAIMRWKHARKDCTAPTKWPKPLDEPDQRLITGINQRIVEKCLGTHDVGTVLVIEIYPAITTKMEFEELKSSICIPTSVPFAAIYVAGSFPHGGDSLGGYFCWKVS
jgi:hypothetical protein